VTAIVLLPGTPEPEVAVLAPSASSRATPASAAGVRVLHADGQVRRWQRHELLAVLSSTAVSAEAAAAQVAALRRRIPRQELELAWQLTEGEATGTGELAQLLLGAQGPAERDAVLVAVASASDGFRLERGQVHRCSEDERSARSASRLAQEAAAAEVAQWLGHVEAVRAGAVRAPPPWTARLQQWLQPNAAADPAVELLLQRCARGATPKTAASLLRELGAWDAHDDLELWQSGLLRPYLAVAWHSESVGPRLDLPWVTIDNDDPHEVDDALCCERLADGWRLWVAIACPADAVGGEVDAEAARRGTTLYHPREVVPMLPGPLAAAHSLAVGLARSALVFRLDLSDSGELTGGDVQAAEVVVGQAWSYTALTAAWQRGEPVLVEARAALRAAEEARIRRGAWLLYKPDVEVRCARHGAVRLNSAAQSSPARRLVAEAMVQCGALAGRLCAQWRLAVPFRTQPPPVRPPLPPGLYDDPAQIHAVLRTLQPTQVELTPRPHGVLGLEAYVQVTSPLRRYGDLLSHRQLLAHLRGQAGLDAARVSERLGQAESGQQVRRQWQRRGERYFKLVWLAGRGIGSRVAGQVVRGLERGDWLVWLDPLALEVPVRAAGVQAGDAVACVLRGVNPGRGEVELQIERS
jgi:exoribonuclease-2